MATPPLPAPMLPYPTDGTVVLTPLSAVADKILYQLNTEEKIRLNDPAAAFMLENSQWAFPAPESIVLPNGSIGFGPAYPIKNYISFIFPRPTTVAGWSASTASYFRYPIGFGTSNGHTGNLQMDLYYSLNTSNGEDGDWTLADSVLTSDSYLGWLIYESAGNGTRFTNPDNRFLGMARTLSGVDNVTGVRVVFPNRTDFIETEEPGGTFMRLITAIRFYGYSGEDERLVFENEDTSTADLRIGNIDPDAQESFDLYVRNTSVLGAGGVFVSADEVLATYDLIRSLPDISDVDQEYLPVSVLQVRLSTDGVTWGSVVELGDIASGGVSPAVSVRVDPIFGTVGYKGVSLHARARRWT